MTRRQCFSEIPLRASGPARIKRLDGIPFKKAAKRSFAQGAPHQAIYEG